MSWRGKKTSRYSHNKIPKGQTAQIQQNVNYCCFERENYLYNLLHLPFRSPGSCRERAEHAESLCWRNLTTGMVIKYFNIIIIHRILASPSPQLPGASFQFCLGVFFCGARNKFLGFFFFFFFSAPASGRNGSVMRGSFVSTRNPPVPVPGVLWAHPSSSSSRTSCLLRKSTSGSAQNSGNPSQGAPARTSPALTPGKAFA